eukprot:scaffold1498_cov197-Skeletonema_marinoi.AAC.5
MRVGDDSIEASFTRLKIEGYMPLLILVILVTAMLGMAASNTLAPYRIQRCLWCNEVLPAVQARAQLNCEFNISRKDLTILGKAHSFTTISSEYISFVRRS